MRKVLLFFILFCNCMLSVCANTRYVIAFDCTRSMIYPTGDYSENGLDKTKIWDPAKKCIESLWTQASVDDEFYILLFQDKVLDIIKGTKGKELRSWNSIERRMNNAITHGGNTCILNAWDCAEQYFTDNCDFYFITDGVEDHDHRPAINESEQQHIEEICKKIRDFCNNDKLSGLHGFYTNLKQYQNDIINNQISEMIKKSCFRDLIAGNITPTTLSFDKDAINKGEKVFSLTFRPIESHRNVTIKNIAVQIINNANSDYLANADEYFDVESSGIENNKLNLSVKHVKKVPHELLDNNSSCVYQVKLSSNDSNFAIFSQLICIKVRYYNEKIAYLPSVELEGTSKYHPAFFISSLADLFSDCDFIAEHKPDTISFDLKKMIDGNRLFNDEAIKHGSTYKLQLIPLRDKDKNAKFILLRNGEICKNNTIDVASSDENILIKIIFDESSVDGTFKFKLVPIEPEKLDKINECANVKEAEIPITVIFDKECNKLTVITCILLSIIVLLGLLKLIISRIRVINLLSFKGGKIWLFYDGKRLTNEFVAGSPRELLLSGANKCVISGTKPSKNCCWKRWFKSGKTVYFYNHTIPYDNIVLYPSTINNSLDGSYTENNEIQTFTLSYNDGQRKHEIQSVTIEYKH